MNILEPYRIINVLWIGPFPANKLQYIFERAADIVSINCFLKQEKITRQFDKIEFVCHDEIYLRSVQSNHLPHIYFVSLIFFQVGHVCLTHFFSKSKTKTSMCNTFFLLKKISSVTSIIAKYSVSFVYTLRLVFYT